MENFRLRVFRAVAHHLNFRMAAEELLLTQSAVTQQIKALESELDVPLFDRAGGRVVAHPGRRCACCLLRPGWRRSLKKLVKRSQPPPATALDGWPWALRRRLDSICCPS